VAFGNETYKLNFTNQNYKYDNYTRNLVGRSFGRCLRNRLLSGSSMKGCVQTLVLNAASRKQNGFQFAFECGDGMWKGLSLFGKAAVAQSV
jgi:hypothetical protein